MDGVTFCNFHFSEIGPICEFDEDRCKNVCNVVKESDKLSMYGRLLGGGGLRPKLNTVFILGKFDLGGEYSTCGRVALF
jgi:hypothetical protein